jgi:hypothetical protein
MSAPILMALVTAVMFLQIGCGKKNKSKQEVKAMVNACMFDPSGQCQRRAKMALENPQLAAQIPAAQASSQANGGTGVVQVTTGPDGQKKLTPVLPQSLQAQALKIQAALEEDSKNPRSMHYDPPQGSQVIADRTPASVPPQASTGSGIAPASTPSAGSEVGSLGQTFR